MSRPKGQVPPPWPTNERPGETPPRGHTLYTDSNARMEAARRERAETYRNVIEPEIRKRVGCPVDDRAAEEIIAALEFLEQYDPRA